MEHAARAVDRDVLVAVTDRRGVILGVAANFDLPAGTTCTEPFPAPGTDCDTANLAVQLARTAAFFSADQTPLTSRSVRFISGEHFPPRIETPAPPRSSASRTPTAGAASTPPSTTRSSTPARSCRARAAWRRRSPI